jgi:hypothetical protein
MKTNLLQKYIQIGKSIKTATNKKIKLSKVMEMIKLELLFKNAGNEKLKQTTKNP